MNIGYVRTIYCKYLTILRYMQEKKENITKTIQRLQEYAKYKHITLNQISVAIGVSNSYFSKMVKNGGSMGEDVIRKILLFYDDLEADWLLTERGEMLKSKAPEPCCKMESVNMNLVQALTDANKALAAASDTIRRQQEMIAFYTNSADYPPPHITPTNPSLNPVDNNEG